MAVDIVVTGVLGRMGRAVADIVLRDEECRLAGCTEAPGHAAIGSEVSSHLGGGEAGLRISGSVTETPFDSSVIIDFTSPQSTLSLVDAVKGSGAKVVVGTTGLDEGQVAHLDEAARTMAVLFSPNMSLGVNMLFRLTDLVASKIGADFDIEIIEAHHRHKKDAPSGTAKRLGEIAAAARGLGYDGAARHGRAGFVGERGGDEIGIHAVRAGDIVGDHTVLFAGPGERIELKHMAHSRETFAKGAVTAAKWLSSQGSGRYSMRDVLGI
jgi:4-hydroxy-tetrahydrodipicolinate reductase